MADPGEKLTYSELLEILVNMGSKLDRTEKALLIMAETFTEWSEFVNMEIIKLGIDSLKRDKKTPYKTLMEVKNDVAMLNGAVHGLYEKRNKGYNFD